MTINDTPNSNPRPAASAEADNEAPHNADSASASASEVRVVISRSADPDARPGVKTRKDGKRETFFGYEEHTLVRVPHGNDDTDAEPRLIARFELTPASTDVVEPSLRLCDRLNTPATEITVDRHYHYKAAERWRDELADRGIKQVHDLRDDEHGFTELNHVRWAAGWPHCPATPDGLGTIIKPGPSAPRAEHDEFARLIDQRRQYAFRRVESADGRGVARWECPAVSGQVGCPLRAHTVEAALEIGVAIIDNPPDRDAPDFPKCCAQRTVKVDPGPLRKLMQENYWGSAEWFRAWNKRTYVEGSYGNRKNPSTENMRRGHTRLAGVAIHNLVMVMAAASYNLRMLRNWHDRTGLGDPDHPLLQHNTPTPDFDYHPHEHQIRNAGDPGPVE